ncbi:YdeI family protein [Myxococcus sp. AB056]|uniref:YdeI/OmpD-associated family protein n=1 Tax=Myxococcus sp. AB056 TaxID=2562792 RepID=UPI001E6024C2|nr:YdeI/OmpD-associated family protein [Myxococcus sp. AB056]
MASVRQEVRGGAAMDAPVIAFRGAAEFEAWLQTHADAPSGVWLKLAKKGTGIPSLTDDEAVDVGLCFGWISGQRRSLDARFYLQKYVPRRPRSRWSCVNVRKVEALLRAGRMRPSGLAEVEAAKADGRWAAAYASQKNATVPEDLTVALSASPHAARAFEAFGKTRRYGLILKVMTARTEKGRASQVRRVVEELDAAAD